MRFNKILCIDDDTTIHFLNKIHIEDMDLASEYVELLHAEAGLDYFEALAKLQDAESEVPQLVLLDLNMALMDGWEFLEKFNTTYSHLANKTKIYIITSSLKPSDIARSKVTPNVYGFFEKPLEEIHFNEIVKDFEKDVE